MPSPGWFLQYWFHCFHCIKTQYTDSVCTKQPVIFFYFTFKATLYQAACQESCRKRTNQSNQDWSVASQQSEVNKSDLCGCMPVQGQDVLLCKSPSHWAAMWGMKWLGNHRMAYCKLCWAGDVGQALWHYYLSIWHEMCHIIHGEWIDGGSQSLVWVEMGKQNNRWVFMQSL